MGLSAAFWAGMREASSRIVDSLPEIGGQLTTLYPEKWIFDVPGYPRILAKDLVEQLREQSLEQFDVPVHLETTAETISWEDDLVVLHTDRGELRSRTVIIAGGHGAFEPKKLPGYDMTPWEGRGAHYLVGEKSEFEGKKVLIVGGGDSACDWVINLLDVADEITLVHRREGFRAHEVTVGQVMQAAAGRRGRRAHALPDQGRGRATATIERVVLFHSEDEGTRSSSRSTPILLQLGFKTALGPLKDWGLEISKGAIVVDPVMKTTLDRPSGRAATSRPSTASSSSSPPASPRRRSRSPRRSTTSAPTRRSSPSTRPTPACPVGPRATPAPRAPEPWPARSPSPTAPSRTCGARTRSCVA